MSIGAIMLCSKSEEYVDLALKSLVGVADKVVVVGDPDLETRNRIAEGGKMLDLEVYWRSWDGDYGAARNFALSKLRYTMLKTDWVISLDADEVLSDDAQYRIRELTQGLKSAYHLRYEHFIRVLGVVDATVEKHIGVTRLFSLHYGAEYAGGMHETIQIPIDDRHGGCPDSPVIYHLGYLKTLRSIPSKYEVNLKKSPIHGAEFLTKWNRAHCTGTYPIRTFDIEKELKSVIIKEAFHL